VLERIKTGIESLDTLIDGFPASRTILITGDAGSGKTIFGLQFAIKNALNGLKTTYITTEEDYEDLEIQSKSFGWDVESLKDKGNFNMIELTGLRASTTQAEMDIGVDAMKGDFEKIIETIPQDTKVVIIDSLGSYTAKLTPYEFRDRFDSLIYELKHRGITSLVILDSSTSKNFNEMALFPVYGAIRLMKRENPYTGQRERVMDIVKMRSTKTPIEFLTYIIGPDGIEIINEVENGITD
jgi:KaiC/GvpD/RAD55 family RecA-like ATPase